MNSSRTCRIFERLAESLPEPRAELNYENDFQLLVAVMLSAQATDVSVNRVTGPLFNIAPTPEAMLLLGEAGLKNRIRTVGLANTKAKNIIKTCRVLVEAHQSGVPQTREALEALPGVGRKTAGVVLNVAFGNATIPVDTHVFRVSNRIGLVRAKNPLETEQQLLRIVPARFRSSAHHLLILHGRYICKARKPLCAQCCLLECCEYLEKTDGSG